jgi:hypothetical protein
MTISVAGRSWSIRDPLALRASHRAEKNRFFMGCKRCGELCLLLMPCKCCLMSKAQRPYDPEGGHEWLPVDLVFQSLKEAS